MNGEEEVPMSEKELNEAARDDFDNTVILKEELSSIAKEFLDASQIGFKNYSITYDYRDYEIPIICYTLTQILSQNKDTFASWGRLLSQPPEFTTIKVGPDKSVKALKEVIMNLKDGMIQSLYVDTERVFKVSLASDNEEGFKKLKQMYDTFVKKYNFYQGRTLRFDIDEVTVLKTPKVEFKDIVLPNDVLDEYKLNTVDFLTDATLRSDSPKRSVILSGPPGTGKTSTVAATFNYLNKRGITTAFLTTDSFSKRDIESVLDFCTKYLAPMVICFEDVDLIGYNRDSGHSSVIGPLLSILNGIDELEHPLVFISTTNRFDVLDAALTRPCRIDRRFTFDYPTKEYVGKIFKSILKMDPPQELFDLERVTGSHIREIYRTTKILAAKAKVSDYKQYVSKAIQIVKSNFYISGTSPGFRVQDNGHNDQKDKLRRSDTPPEIQTAGKQGLKGSGFLGRPKTEGSG